MADKTSISNTDIIPFALYELGGAGTFIDIEDLFIRCYEISPERFGWRKYQFPNYKILYQALFDFEEKNPQLIIKTADGLSRQLTAEGVGWLKQRSSLIKILETPEKAPPTHRPQQRILNDITNHYLFRSFMANSNPKLDKYEVAELLLCSPDSPTSLWKERLETYRSAASNSNRMDLVKFLDYLVHQQPEWFGGN